MKKVSKSLRKHTVKIINFLKMKLLIKEQQESYENAKICYICNEKFERKNIWKIKNILYKSEIIAVVQENIEEQRM